MSDCLDLSPARMRQALGRYATGVTVVTAAGAQGPIAVSLDSFERYQQEAAWTWEHMALARARVLHGQPEGRAELERIIQTVLTMPRDSAKLRQDVLHMRSEMARHKPGKGPLDVKLARGGLVDIEFLTHYLQLHAHVGLIPAIPAALAALVEAGLLAPPIVEAHAALARFLIAARLLAPDSEEPPAAAREVLARACQCGDWEELKANLAAARRTVAASWSAVFGEQLELEP